MLLPFLFFLIALVYSMVGLGGGSSYIAILALFDFPYRLIPIVALVCNVIVVSSGAFNYYKRGHFKWSLFWPFAISSVPMAFIGGLIPIGKEVFLFLLAICLLFVSLRLIFLKEQEIEKVTTSLKRWKAILIGAVLGLLAGITGIGGGIYLSPLLLHFRWALPKQVAAVSAFFILINSLSGIAGQLIKNAYFFSLFSHWTLSFLFLAVCLGGQIGSRIGASPLISQQTVRKVTALLVLVVSLRILYRLLFQ